MTRLVQAVRTINTFVNITKNHVVLYSCKSGLIARFIIFTFHLKIKMHGLRKAPLKLRYTTDILLRVGWECLT